MGNGLLPLLPIYAIHLGATRETAGYYVAFSFLCVSAGALLGGRLSDLLRRRRPLLAGAGLASMAATWLIGRAGSVLQLALATGGSWLLGGLCLGIVGALAGKHADDRQRGRVFGILGMMVSLGSLIGGLTFGRIVDARGYGAMTSVASLVLLLIPLAALLPVDLGGAPTAKRVSRSAEGTAWISPAFLLLLVAEILAMTVAGTGNMGRSLLMSEKAFGGSQITTTMAVAGLVSLPLPFILGWLSDSLGRGVVMLASFAAGIASLLVLTVSQTLAEFSAATALLSLHAVSMTLGPALAADVVPAERVGTGVSFFQSAAWIGTIGGYIYSGISFPRFGMVPSLLAGAAFPAIAIVVLLARRSVAAVVTGRRTEAS